MSPKNICVIGLGYIGLPTACTFAKSGHFVTGMDVNPDVVNALRKGKTHIFEPGLQELLDSVVNSGNFKISSVVTPADVFIISVPTPFHENKHADLTYVKSAAESIVPHLKPNNLVILESTSPPRTTMDIVGPILQESGLIAGKDFYLAYSPERVLPGNILNELVNNARVIGGIDTKSSEAGYYLYKDFVKGEIKITDATTAEMVKLMENTYRDINIAIANEFCRLADRFNVDIWEAIETANLHPRVNILKPGIGVGGHCISVDPWFLVEAAPEQSPLVLTARKVNDSQPEFVCNTIERNIGNLNGKKIALLGLAFKPEVDDIRESPAVDLAITLKKKGALLTAYEPFKKNFTHPLFNTGSSLKETLEGSDIIILAVAHREFITINPNLISQTTQARIVFDAVNGWARKDWEIAGFKFFGLAKK